MEAIQMVTGLDEKMSLWRQGCLSDAEIMKWLLTAQTEVLWSMEAAEIVEAEQRMKRIGI